MDFVSTHNAREMYSRAGWTIAFAVVLYFINRAEYPGPALTLFIVITLIGLAMGAIGYGLHWLATEGRRQVHAQLLDSLGLQGSERILSLAPDLGMEAARRLKSGKVVSLGETAANEAARETAKNQGLIDRIRFEAGDPLTKLSYPDANFDFVIGPAPTAKAMPELTRVLKSGGCIVLVEVGERAAVSAWPNASYLATAVPFRLGGRIVSARKQ